MDEQNLILAPTSAVKVTQQASISPSLKCRLACPKGVDLDL